MRSIRRVIGATYQFFFPNAYKHRHEMRFLKSIASEQKLKRGHVSDDVRCDADLFNLRLEDYNGKRVLDISCGPMGSLDGQT